MPIKSFAYLDQYNQRGKFGYRVSNRLSAACNALQDVNGVYLVYAVTSGVKELVYIGSSGNRQQDGTLTVREGTLYDRIVNGK